MSGKDPISSDALASPAGDVATELMMNAARTRRATEDERLLVLDPISGRIEERAFAALPSLLRAGDVLVVNDAATRPSSLAMVTAADQRVEVRIVSERPSTDARDGEHDDGPEFDAVLFGDGDWRMDTDLRPPPPLLERGDVLFIDHAGAGAPSTASGSAVVVDVDPRSARHVTLRFDRALSATLFARARPVQYRYIDAPLTLADVQTPYASRPWAAEMPSAGRALRVSMLVELRRKGVRIARVTAAAGLSATGDPALDRALPFPERYEIPQETVDIIADARARPGARVIAVGTSTVRALESAAFDAQPRERAPQLRAGEGTATLILGPRSRLRVVDAILSGMHESGTSHDAVLRAFAPGTLVDRAVVHGRARGLLVHELGDHCLVLPGSLPTLLGQPASDRAARAPAASTRDRTPRARANAPATAVRRALLLLSVALTAALAAGCAAPLIARALPDDELVALRAEVGDDLKEPCGKCHQSTLPTAKPAALAIFDLDTVMWTATIHDDQLPDVIGRLPLTASDELRTRTRRLMEAELALRDAAP